MTLRTASSVSLPERVRGTSGSAMIFARACLADGERFGNLRQAPDRGIDLGGTDAYTAGIQDGIGAPVDHQAVVRGEGGVVPVMPDAGEALEVGGAVLGAGGIVPEADGHRRKGRSAHELAALAGERPAGVVEDLD